MEKKLFEDTVESEPEEQSEKPLHFFYNREERIAHAPEIVKKYYAGEMNPVRGFKIFFTKQNRFILLALILFIGAAWVYTAMNNTRSFASIDGINLELTAFSYEQEVYTSLQIKRSKKSKKKTPCKIEAYFFCIENNNQIYDKQELSLIYEDGEQYLRTKFSDYDIIRVDVIVKINEQEKELSCGVKR